MDIFGKEIDLIARLNQMDLNGWEILNFIINGSNSYDWYKNIDQFF